MSSVILPVPHVPQRQLGECLAACAAMLLLYLGLSVNYDRLLKLLQIWPDAGGVPAPNIRELERLGVTVIYKQGTLEELEDHLLNNRPCLALVQTGELPYWDEDTLHAVVVIGLDENTVHLNDPSFLTAPIQVSRGDFDLAWLARDEMYATLMRPD